MFACLTSRSAEGKASARPTPTLTATRVSAVATPQPDAVPVFCSEATMRPKAHGTSSSPVQKNLRFGADASTADRICNFNRHYAERSGYFASTKFLKETAGEAETTFYDSVTGLPLFVAPRGRTRAEFVAESKRHGWPSFRDEEVVWANVRVLEGSGASGEAVSATGTHLGHNLPSADGRNRYCINLVSVAGRPRA